MEAKELLNKHIDFINYDNKGMLFLSGIDNIYAIYNFFNEITIDRTIHITGNQDLIVNDTIRDIKARNGTIIFKFSEIMVLFDTIDNKIELT